VAGDKRAFEAALKATVKDGQAQSVSAGGLDLGD